MTKPNGKIRSILLPTTHKKKITNEDDILQDVCQSLSEFGILENIRYFFYILFDKLVHHSEKCDSKLI